MSECESCKAKQEIISKLKKLVISMKYTETEITHVEAVEFIEEVVKGEHDEEIEENIILAKKLNKS